MARRSHAIAHGDHATHCLNTACRVPGDDPIARIGAPYAEGTVIIAAHGLNTAYTVSLAIMLHDL
ncbi:hypothetical protein [Paenibacillus xerothermodurans]|uniref:Uncharacterized protein n=1 Tax=Paenibacillus xerothermodurans TaxID=1977292 RepID=A0A2W1P183_PAEXE|nr:hypothetical protein [Paenibacillus xerothermodurans]PZE20848.1 hypothetical protein CBW46_011905 [Paenibacillus xerothermodurans]